MVRYIWEYENWNCFKWQDDRILPPLGKTRFCQGGLLARVKNLGMLINPRAQAEVLTEETIKTAAIEGEALDKESVRSSVARHLGIPYAGTMRINRHIEGLVDVLLDATQNYRQPLSFARLKAWHAALFPTGFSGLREIPAGRWRGNSPMEVVSGPLGKEKVHFLAPPRKRLEGEMRQFVSWWKKSLGVTDGLLRAGIAHFWFVTIHPFEDGNGRIARALTDMALAQDEEMAVRFYSLSSQIMEERKDYYIILEECQKGHRDITRWLVWFLGCLSRAIEKSGSIVGRVLSKADFWRIHSRKILNERQKKVINRLLDSGQGGFKGGLTTRKYISMTKVSRATAFREISDLLEKKLISQNSGRGRSVSYDINWP